MKNRVKITVTIEAESAAPKSNANKCVIVGGVETIVNPKNAKEYEVNLDSKNAAYALPIADKLYKVDATGGVVDLIAGAADQFMVETETTTTTDTTTTTTGEAGSFSGTSTSESTSTSTTGGGNLTLS